MAGVTGDIYFRGDIPQSRYCGGCAHYQRLGASDSHNVRGARVCLYILDMNHSRGCAAGLGCERWISEDDWAKTPIGRPVIRERKRRGHGKGGRRKEETKLRIISAISHNSTALPSSRCGA